MGQVKKHKDIQNMENAKKDSKISHVTYVLSIGVIPNMDGTFNIIPEVASTVKIVKIIFRYLH